MTEDEIERRVEKMMDHLDRIFMAGGMTQKNYNHAVTELHQWSEVQYRKLENERVYALYRKHH